MNSTAFLKNKLLAAVITGIVSSVVFMPVIKAEGSAPTVRINDVYFEVNDADEKINEKYLILNGELSQKIKDEISFVVVDSDGRPTDVLQTVSDENGKFSFKSTFDRTDKKGKYTVRVNSSAASGAVQKDVEYSGINNAAEMISFKLDGVSGTISGGEITVKFSKYVDVKKMAAEFVTSENARVYVNNVRQTSGESKNDYTKTVEYKVVSEDKSNTKTYYVKCEIPTGNISSGGSGGGGGASSGISHIDYSGVKSDDSNNNGSNDESKDEALVFVDVSKDDWAYKYIYELYTRGIVRGAGDGRFYPDENITREEFVKMLVCALGLDEETDLQPNFDDVDLNSWYAPFIGAAYSHKIVNGISETVFGTGQNITREDMAVMAYRAMLGGENKNQSIDNGFKDDGDISDYAKGAVYSMRDNEILCGTESGFFEPKRYSKRSEAAKIIYNCMTAKSQQRGALD